MFQWEEGARRLRDATRDDRPALERATARIVAELRRRLGGPFSAQELADLYDQGTDWTLEVARAAAPDNPRAWEAQVVADAAFLRYLREATDFAGGRLITEER